ncbi:hypothetical protein C464_16142 [Halorubrum coriense DSM 10284]|uniref:Uncharacterized protein n=1 Tax=Halorubrum coriense DSM 10284 TaxID=1227466 RepID=M0E7A7_9EURY|nr:hypothetical protein [Halorubrum coriense]ELZ43696.1 hypothetical protein C464_16142 [Halorubrum coriense DSM 10284]
MIADERAVSDLVGFILSFSIILLSVSVVYTGGFAAITDQQEAEQMHNTERAMTVLAENFRDIERGNAPTRAGEFRLSGGRLSLDRAARFTVVVGLNNSTVPVTVRTRSLSYEKEGTEISYENGAVLRTDGEFGFMARAPTVTCRADRAIVSLVEIDPRGNRTSTSGEGSVLVTVTKQDSGIYYPRQENGTVVNEADAARNVTIRVEESRHEEGWENWFEERDGWNQTAVGYTCEADTVVVRTTKVTVEFLR